MYLFDHSFFPDNFPRLNMGISFFLLLLPLMLFLSLFSGSGSPIVNVSLSFFGILYIAVPFSLWSLTVLKEEFVYDLGNRIEYTPHYLLGFFFLVWSNDTFAYLVGKPLGRTKLFERISPKKTWEGFIGGVVLTQGVAYILSIYFTELPLRDWMVIGAIVSVFGTLGDLVESMFKRSLNVKDSGGILPGHGGILDRFDGVLLASPFVVTYLLLMR
jgi:phosphatidate cytidylyltransferase